MACLLAFSFVSAAVAADDTGNLGFDENFLVLPGYGGQFSEGLMALSEANDEISYGFIDAQGKQRIAPGFTNPAVFHEGLAAVSTETYKYGYIDAEGRFIIPPLFDYVQNFDQGKAIVILGDQMQIINKQGEFLLPKSYGSVFFDTNIEKYLCIEHSYAEPGKTDIYNKNLELERSFPYQFSAFYQLAGKTVGVSYESTGKARVFDYNTNETISPNDFSGNDYFVYIENDFIISIDRDKGEILIYNEKGNLLLQTEGNNITHLSGELFFVRDWVHGKTYMVTPTSKQEVSFEIQGQLAPGLFLFSKIVEQGDIRYGAMDSDCNETIPAEYSWIYSSPSNFICAEKGDTVDVYSLAGELLRQFSEVAAFFSLGPDSVVYQDTAGFLHFLDGEFNEYYAVHLPGLEWLGIMGENTYYAAVSGQMYTILDKRKINPQIPEYSITPVKELDLTKITKDTTVYLMLDNFKQVANGTQSILDRRNMNVPLLIEDSTLVPIEALRGCLNGVVRVEGDYIDTTTAEIKFLDRVLTLTIGSHSAELKYFVLEKDQYVTESKSLEVPAQLIEDTIFVPLRAVTEILGFHVYWHDSGLIGLSNYPLQPTEQEVQQLLAGFADYQATPRELQKMDASLATQPYLDFISAKLTGIADVYNIAYYSNTIPAYEALIAKTKDLILVTEPSPDMLNLAQENGVELNLVPFAKEGFVFLVNQENPVDSLTEQQLRDIYQGKITNWLEVGGLDAPIEAYQRNENSGSQTIMENNFMQGLPLIEPIMGQRIMSMEGLIDVVAEYREEVNAALGYSVYYYAREMYDSGQTKLLQVNGVAPGTETIRSGEYPLIVNYYAVTRKDDTSASTQKLLDFILSTEGQAYVNESGLVSVR